MADIQTYRKLVELQTEIVRISRQNRELEMKCRQLQYDLGRNHTRAIRRKQLLKRIRKAFVVV